MKIREKLRLLINLIYLLNIIIEKNSFKENEFSNINS